MFFKILSEIIQLLSSTDWFLQFNFELKCLKIKGIIFKFQVWEKGLESFRFSKPLFLLRRSELLTHNLGQKMVGYANCISFSKLAVGLKSEPNIRASNVFLKTLRMSVERKNRQKMTLKLFIKRWNEAQLWSS